VTHISEGWNDEGNCRNNARDDQDDALGTLHDGGGPALLRVRHRDGLVAGPLVEKLYDLGGAADYGPDFAPEHLETRLPKIDREGLDESLRVLAEHEDDLVQLVLAPCEGARRPSAEGLL